MDQLELPAPEGLSPEERMDLQAAVEHLPEAERELVQLRYFDGLTNREIGERLFLSPNTVKDYLDDLMDKTGIHSRTALVAQASRLGIAVSDAERTKGASK